ncbi:MAG: hypothetical protein M1347_06415 [Chloroflexi bacterium]|nr:hypothetical protein [Chloroflexota bacterium]
MRHEDWAEYQRELEEHQIQRFGTPPPKDADRITELRREVDGLARRIKKELLAELKVEIERLITLEVEHADHSFPRPNKQLAGSRSTKPANCHRTAGQ